MLIATIKIITLILPLLLGIAFITLAERKVMGAAHRRYGPNTVGIGGLLQPVFDGVKLILKETIITETSSKILFIISPILTFMFSMLGGIVIPFEETAIISNINLGIMYLLSLSTLSVYSILLAGGSSNSRYALLGGLRSASQMISYEITIGIIMLNVCVCVGSFNLIDIIMFQQYIGFIIPLFPMAILFFISAIAETNRAPFDLPEAETELVSGYNVEYSAAGFALFFMAEYSNILLMCAMFTILFLGGGLGPTAAFNCTHLVLFSFKGCITIFLFIGARVSFPRYRYDQLIRLGGKVFLPLSLGGLLLTISIVKAFDGLQ